MCDSTVPETKLQGFLQPAKVDNDVLLLLKNVVKIAVRCQAVIKLVVL